MEEPGFGPKQAGSTVTALNLFATPAQTVQWTAGATAGDVS